MSVTQFGAILSLVGAALFPLPTLLPLRQPDFETPSSCLGHAGVPGTTQAWAQGAHGCCWSQLPHLPSTQPLPGHQHLPNEAMALGQRLGM